MSLGSLDHVGITVPDLDQAIEFFTSVIGWTLITRDGPFSDPEGDWMERALDVDRRTILSLALMETGAGSLVELFECSAPGQENRPPRLSDVGGCHLGLRVADLDGVMVRLKTDHKVRVLDGPNPGFLECRYVYFVTPWGLLMELLEPASPPSRDGALEQSDGDLGSS